MRSALALIALDAAAAMVARPALRIGGEWAGHCVTFSDAGMPTTFAEKLTTEEWMRREDSEEPSPAKTLAALSRRTIRPEGAEVSQAVLPKACSDAAILQPGNSMFEPEVLNARAWALDGDGVGTDS